MSFRANARAIAAIDAAALLGLLEAIDGAEMGRRVSQRLDAIFAFASLADGSRTTRPR